ncbi:alpha/beta fold hydrolase [Intrasporangium sp.]|uniref:alpha/beta fold hydrolase n=1 Tax=Intrasporangium sp. TaxID=1925024 RepID=UPI00293B5963|nr:alpha/beta fold hydrolase [Intrasporangium sp.]MDV3219794.1 alpha/beta fold hydrolase [Intrasporangium sp.]
MLNDRLTTVHHLGLVFDVTDGGPADGTPVVLLHGFPADRTSWDPISERLHAAGMRTYAPDQRGYSRGATPPGTAAYRLEHLVGDVIALIDATGHEKVHLVGHDWGGAISWLTAGNHPHRVASVTVLSTPHPAALSRALKTPGQLRRSWYMALFQVPALPERVVAAGFRSLMVGTGLPLEDAERYAARLATPAALRGPISWYRATRSSHVRARRVTVPATYVWGSRDAALGRRAAELTRDHVTGPYEFVELDATHWLPETRPDECAAAIVRRVESTG